MFDNEGVISLMINYSQELGLSSEQFVAVTTNDDTLQAIASEMTERLTNPCDERERLMNDRGDMAKIVSALKQSLEEHCCA